MFRYNFDTTEEVQTTAKFYHHNDDALSSEDKVKQFDGQCEKLSSLEPSAIDDWLVEIKRERTDDGRLLLSAKQFDMVKIVAHRVQLRWWLLPKGKCPKASRCGGSCTVALAQGNPT